MALTTRFTPALRFTTRCAVSWSSRRAWSASTARPKMLSNWRLSTTPATTAWMIGSARWTTGPPWATRLLVIASER
jgi:hypothetical protein